MSKDGFNIRLIKDISFAINKMIEYSLKKNEEFIELAEISNLDPEFDFVGGDLRNIDFRDQDLSSFDLTGADLSGCDLRRAVANSTIERAKLKDAIGLKSIQIVARRSTSKTQAIYKSRSVRRGGFAPDEQLALEQLSIAQNLFSKGDFAESILISEKLMDIFEVLFVVDPHHSQINLISNISVLINCFTEIKNFDSSLKYIGRLIDVYKQSPSTDISNFRAELPRIFRSLSRRYASLENKKSALNIAERTVSTIGFFSKSATGYMAPELARALTILGHCLAALNREPESIEAYEKSVDLTALYCEQFPEKFYNLIREIREDYFRACENLGISPDPRLLERIKKIARLTKEQISAPPVPDA